jgi:hypothetical protein
MTIEINFEPGVLQSNVSAEVEFYEMTIYVWLCRDFEAR